MPRGLPDYFNPDTVVSQRLFDLHTIMAALTRLVPIDGRGRIVYFNHFDEGLSGWYSSMGGDGVAPTLSTLYAEVPPCSVQLDGGTLAGGGSSFFRTRFYEKPAPIAGLDVALAFFPQDALTYLVLQYDAAPTRYDAELRFYNATGLTQLLTPTGWVTVATVGAFETPYLWLPVKMVCDFQTGYYSRVVLGQTNYDVSANPINTQATSQAGEVFLHIQSNGQEAAASLAYVGHVILTLDEP